MKYQCCFGSCDIDRLPTEAEETVLNNYLLRIFRMVPSAKIAMAVKMEDAISFDKMGGAERDVVLRNKFPDHFAEWAARREAREQQVSASLRTAGLSC